MEPQRQVAIKCSIKDVIMASFIKEEGWNPNFLMIDQKKVSRLNIIATILSKDMNENNIRFVIDDGTAPITMITYDRVPGIDDAEMGKCVLIIGRPRSHNEEKFIVPESIRLIEKEWLEVRKTELKRTKIHEQPQQTQQPISIDMTPHEHVIELIKNLDAGEGTSYDKLSDIKDIDLLLNQLLERGEIFEISPARYKLLD